MLLDENWSIIDDKRTYNWRGNCIRDVETKNINWCNKMFKRWNARIENFDDISVTTKCLIVLTAVTSS